MNDLVNGDDEATNYETMAKITARYTNMTNEEIKSNTLASIKAVADLMDTAAKKYVKEDLSLVAVIDLSIIKFLDEGITKLFADIDKIGDAKLKHSDLVKLGATAQLLKDRSEIEDKRRAANPLKVTDTAENLLKKYKEEYKKMTDLLKWTADKERKVEKERHLEVWVKLHQGVSK